MKLKDMKFKIVLPEGKTYIVGWDQIFGYEGEDCGVFARIPSPKDRIPWKDILLTKNSGYGFDGINEDIDIEVISDSSSIPDEPKLSWNDVTDICLKICGRGTKQSDDKIYCPHRDCNRRIHQDGKGPIIINESDFDD